MGIDVVMFRVEVFFSSYYRRRQVGIGIGLVGSSLCSGNRPGKFRAVQINTPVNPQGLIERSINSAFGMVLLRKWWTSY